MNIENLIYFNRLKKKKSMKKWMLERKGWAKNQSTKYEQKLV